MCCLSCLSCLLNLVYRRRMGLLFCSICCPFVSGLWDQGIYATSDTREVFGKPCLLYRRSGHFPQPCLVSFRSSLFFFRIPLVCAVPLLIVWVPLRKAPTGRSTKAFDSPLVKCPSCFERHDHLTTGLFKRWLLKALFSYLGLLGMASISP